MAPRFTRFSLRILLVSLTTLCAVLALLAHQLDWVRQRRDFINQQDEIIFGLANKPEPWYPDYWYYYRAPYLLWVFGETRKNEVSVIVSFDEVQTTAGSDEVTMSRRNATFQRATRLFPEAHIQVFATKATVYPLSMNDTLYPVTIKE